MYKYKTEPFKQEISVKKGTHTVKLNDTSVDLLKKLTKQIKDKDIEKIITLSTKTIKEFALSHRNKPDEAYDQINEIIKKELTEIIIKPISEKMDPLIGSQSNFVFESLYNLELGLTELILDPLVEQIPSIFNNILADQKYKPMMVTEGKVTKVTKYGAFIELEKGISGLIHKSKLKGADLTKGDTINIKIGSVNVSDRKITMNMA